MIGNLLTDLPADLEEEQFCTLLQRPGVRLERIVSFGHATPPGEWLSQTHDEWVLLTKGAATLTLEGEAPTALRAGDHVLIPAGRRHRVDWSEPKAPTVWLALHVG